MLFLSKVVVIVAWTLPLWLLHSAVTFAIVMSRAHRTPTRAELGAWLLLLAVQYGLLLVLMMVAVAVQLVTRSRIAAIMLPVLLFFGAIIIQVATSGSDSILAKALMAVNPMFHLNRITRYWADPVLLDHALLHVGIGLPLLLALCLLALRGRELS